MSIFDALFEPFRRRALLQARVAELEIRNRRLQEEIDGLLSHRADMVGWAGGLVDKASSKCEECERRRIEDLNRTGEEKRDLEKFNDAQAARGMARNTKQHFQAYQATVKIMLDRLDDLGKQNHVTKEDLRKLRQLRIDLSNQLGRSI